MAAQLTGEYITKRDGGIAYTWEADYGMHGDDWHCEAKVRRDGHLAGHPRMVIFKAPSFVEDPYVRAWIEDCIEHRVAVE